MSTVNLIDNKMRKETVLGGDIPVGTYFKGIIAKRRSLYLRTYDNITDLLSPNFTWTTGRFPIVYDYIEVDITIEIFEKD